MESIEISPTLLILAGIICVGMGIFASMLLNTLREDEGVGDGGNEAPPGGKKGRYTPVVRLWNERNSGKLVVEVEGKSFVSPEPLNENQREQLEKVAREFRGWLGMGLAAAPAKEAGELPRQAEITSADPAESSLPANGGGISQAPVEPAQSSLSSPAGTAAPAISARPYQPPSSVPRRATDPVELPDGSAIDAAAVIGSTRSIVMQIEDILQDMLASNPQIQKEIHLHEDPTRGVIVSVDTNYYEGIDSVPDPEVKAVIRSAVTAWERRQ